MVWALELTQAFCQTLQRYIPKTMKISLPLKTIKNSGIQQLPDANYTYIIWVCFLHLDYSFR